MPFYTLAAVRAALWNTASKVPYASRVAADTALVDSQINLAAERLLDAMSYRGTFATVRLRAWDEQITLPSGMDGIRALRLVNDDGSLGRQYQVHSQQASHASGSCLNELDYPFINPGPIRDLGDGFATFRDYNGEFYIRCKTALTEAGTATILLRGLNEDGDMIYQSNGTEGVSLAITTADTTTSQAFTFLNYWMKSAATAGMVQLFAVDTTTGDEELIVNILPQKLTSGFRRYYAPFGSGQTVEALCNVAYIPAVADNDPIYPANLGALKLAIMSLNYEDKNDLERAALYMGPNYPEATGKPTGALDILEKERAKYDGDEVSTVAFSGFGSQPFMIGGSW